MYGIARQSGGLARIASAPGTGTTATLLLRQAVAAALPAEAAVAAAGDAATGSGAASILVIDDDEDVRSLLAESLAFVGYLVRDAADGRAGLALMADCLPDLLLIDYLMPGMNGAEVVKLARERGYNMPVIFATGYADSRALDAACGLKATVLAKPFSLARLQQAIEAALGRPKQGGDAPRAALKPR